MFWVDVKWIQFLENFWEHICSMYMLKKAEKNEIFQSPKLNQWWQWSQNHPGYAHWTMKSRIEIRFGKHGSEGEGKKFFQLFFPSLNWKRRKISKITHTKLNNKKTTGHFMEILLSPSSQFIWACFGWMSSGSDF